MKKWSVVTSLLVLSVIILALGIVGSAQEGPKRLKIGALLPMTGPGAAWGVDQQRCMQLVVDDINGKGGIKIGGKSHMIEVVIGDDKYTGAGATDAVSRLIYEQGVKYIIGPIGSTPVLAVSPIVTKAKVLLLPNSFVKEAIGPDKPYNFRIFFTSNEIDPIIWRYVKKNYPQVKTVVAIGSNDATGIGQTNDVEKAAQAEGVKVLSKELHELGITDFNPLAAKVVAMKPDVIDPTCTPLGYGAKVIKALYEVGYKGILVSTAWSDARAIVPVTGKNAIEGMIGRSLDQFNPASPPRLRQFAERYLKKYGEAPLLDIPMFAQPIWWLEQAMEATQSLEVDKIVAYFENPKNVFQTVFGEGKFGGKEYYGVNHQIIMPIPVCVIRDGKNVMVQEPQMP